MHMMRRTSITEPLRTILAVDDDPDMLRLLSLRLRAEGYRVVTATSGAEALAIVIVERPDLVITDLRMEGMDGLGLLAELQERWPALRVLLLTAHGTIPDAVTATRMGAAGFLTKPVDRTELVQQVGEALRHAAPPAPGEDWSRDIITRSPLMQERLRQTAMIAATGEPVLIVGETGTGKELLARAIHRASPRAEQPFIGINCSILPGNGADAGADPAPEACVAQEVDVATFRSAAGGTLFLDDVGDLPERWQVELLHLLHDGGNTPDVRLLSATHADLSTAVEAGTFREDLYYRLNVAQLRMPRLEERREDVPLLAACELARIASETGRPSQTYSPEAMEMLVGNDWPGNIRQLLNTVRQTAATCPERVIGAGFVAQALGTPTSPLRPFNEAREDFARNYLVRILRVTGGNVSRAARLARRNRTDFYKLLARHSIDPELFKAS
jgi:two-component system response regulator GlrR